MNLTQKIVDEMRGEARLKIVYDDSLACFGVRVMPSGSRSYFIRYRVKGAKIERTQTIGKASDLTLKEARDSARKLMARARMGDDPRGVVRADAMTVSQLCDRYLQEHSHVYKKPCSIAQDEVLVRRYIKPQIGSELVVDLKRSQVQAVHGSMRQTPYMANRGLSTISKMMTLAEVWGLRPDGSNPCRHVKRYKETAREVFLTDEQLAGLARELDAHPNKVAVAAIKAIMLTGARKNEIQRARLVDLKPEHRVLILPDSKTGAGFVTLNQATLDIMAGLPRHKGQKYIFEVDGDPVNARFAWETIRIKAGLSELRIHDLRHLFGTMAHSSGASLRTIATLLRHSNLNMSARYVQRRAPEVIEAVEKTGSAIAGLLNPTA